MKNVLLIGDSIRMGYCQRVKENLKDVADVRWPNENCRCTQYTYISIWQWINIFDSPEKVDYIHWNNGQWDVAHWYGDEKSLNTPKEYAVMLKRIYLQLKKSFPNAKVVFATTTPMSPANIKGGNPRSTEEIKVYNQAALEVMNELEVEVDDLFTAQLNVPAEDYKDYCHLTDQAFARLGDVVSDFILKTM